MAIKDYSSYYDDFLQVRTGGKSAKDKNYLRILFNSGRAVQVREVNQIQSMLQNQIDTFGRSIYKEGTAVIDGVPSYDTNTYYVDIDISDAGLIGAETYIGSIEKLAASPQISSVSKSIKAEVLGYQKTYSQPSTGVRYRFYVRYLQSYQLADGTNQQEFLTAAGSSGTDNVIKTDTDGEIKDANNQTIIAANTTIGTVHEVGYAAQLQVNAGVYFINGCFVVNEETSAFISKPSRDDEITGTLVWQVTENTVLSSQDDALLDNASGQPNYSAPGADRYQIELALKFITNNTDIIGQTSTTNSITNNNTNVLNKTGLSGQFVNLLDITQSVPLIPARTEYSQLDRTLAERTFEESGNYSLKQFQIDIREYLNDTDDGGNRGRYTKEQIKNGDANNGTQITTGADEPNISGLADATLIDTDSEALTYGDARFVVGVEPAIAYVYGYRVDLQEKAEIVVPKARTTQTLENIELSQSVGGFVIGDLTDSEGTTNALFDPKDALSSTAKIYDNETPSSGNEIGTCRLRNIEKISDDVYNLYVFDVNINVGKTFKDGKAIATTGSARFEFSNANGFELQNAAATISMIQLPVPGVKAINIANVKTREKFSAGSSSNNTTDLTATNGVFHATATSEYVLYSDDDGESDFHLTAEPTTSDGIDSATLTLTHNSVDMSNGTINAPVEKTSFVIGAKTEATVTDTAINNTAASTGSIIEIPGFYDGIQLTGVKVDASGGGTFVSLPLSDFEFDDGGRANTYEPISVKYVGSTSYTSSADWKFSFKHFEHPASSAFDFFTVTSYPIGTNNFKYEDIPYYQGVSLADVIDFRKANGATNGTGAGEVFPFDPNGIMEITSLEYYVPRKDKLIVNNVGEFKVIQGKPSTEPVLPETPKNAMCLYELSLNAYTAQAENEITLKANDNRRFTMKDIGKLEKKIEQLEYYTSLSLLEKETLDKNILTNSGGQRFKNGILVDSFKGHNIGNPQDTDYSCSIDQQQGILRPQFEMHDTLLKLTADSGGGDLEDDMYELTYTESDGTSSPHLIEQLLSSVSESVNPFDLADWQGVVELNPTSDEWKEVNKRPDLIINDSSAYDQMKEMADENNMLGTIWGEWETAWQSQDVDVQQVRIGRLRRGFLRHRRWGWGRGRWWSGNRWWHNRARVRGLEQRRALGLPTHWGSGMWRPVTGNITTTTTTTGEQREVIRRSLSFRDQTQNLGEKVLDTSFVPFIRSRRIQFHAELMKPNTRLYAFFDKNDVSSYCSANSSMTGGGTYSAITNSAARDASIATFTDEELSDLQGGVLNGRNELITDDNGEIRGFFVIPNNKEMKFRTGERQFKLTDSKFDVASESTTQASCTYNASGLIETKQTTIINTRIPQINEHRSIETRQSTSSKKEVNVRYYDPLAQSFIIGDYERGAYVTGIDLWFQKKHDTIPVRTHLVTVENGVPTQNVVPGTEVIKKPADVNASTVDGSDTTNLTAANTATTFQFKEPVLLLPGVEYAIVVLSNSPEYRLYMAEVGGTDNVTQERIAKNPYAGVSFKSQNASTWTPTQNRDFKFRIKKATFGTSRTFTFETQFNGEVTGVTSIVGGSGYNEADTTVTFAAPVGGGVTATGVPEITGGAITGIRIVNKGSGYKEVPTITIADSNASPGNGASAIAVMKTIENSYVRLLAEEIVPDGTDITYTYQFEGDAAQTAIEPNEIVSLGADKVIGVGGSGQTGKKVTIRATMTTTDTNITPQLDSQRFSILSVKNLISSETGNTAQITSSSSAVPGVAANDSRIDAAGGFKYLSDTGLEAMEMSYITRTVDLAAPADKLSVFLNINRPSSNENVRVCVRLREADEDYESLEWYEIKPVTNIEINGVGNELEFTETEFDYDASELSNASDPNKKEFTGFAVRVILTADNHRIVPTVRDFRAVASFA